jgi:voltage-gated potassium channel
VSERQDERRRLRASLLRMCLVMPAVFALFAIAPLQRSPSVDSVVVFLAALGGFGLLVGYQVVAVTRSPFPWIRALEGAMMCVPVLLVLFATTYTVMGRADPDAFSEPLDRLDALYFATTVFSTVGFGDVVATSSAARAVVSVQMVVDLVVVGLFARVLVKAAERRREALHPRSPD